MGLHIEIHRTDQDVGLYHMEDHEAARNWLCQLEPRRLFRRKNLLIAGKNSVSLINTETIAWLYLHGDATTDPLWFDDLSFGFGTQGESLLGRASFIQELELARLRWQQSDLPAQNIEAIGEFLFKGGLEFYLRLTSDKLSTAEQNALLTNLFQLPVLRSTNPLGGLVLLNPQAISRARLYTSKTPAQLPMQTIYAEPQDFR